MVSEMAVELLEDMREEGLEPSVRDIIRLNALALKCENHSTSPEVFFLPRVAYLGSLAFREPTIGHDIWVESVSNFCDKDDWSTSVAIRAFAFSRGVEDLPDANCKKDVVKAVNEFTKKELSAFTTAQVQAAIRYAEFGSDAIAAEYPVQPDDGRAPYDDDVALAVGAGVLFETVAIGLGLSVREISEMPIAKARRLQEIALARHGIDISKGRKTASMAGFYATFNDIKDRLKAEKDSSAKGR